MDEVLLVGGSTRIPYLRTLIQSVFDNKVLSKAVNPDEAVALGAALMASEYVQLIKEVLSLNTQISQISVEKKVEAGTELPHSHYVSTLYSWTATEV